MSPSGGRRPPEPEPTNATYARAAAVIWIVLALLAAARAAFAFVPSMAAWGINTMRFLPPVVAWGAWTLTALSLVPAISRRAAGALESGPARAGRRTALTWMVAGGAMLLVLLIPDRTWYVGDFMMRMGAVVERQSFDLFRQAMPLDELIHYRLRLWLWQTIGLDANASARLIGLLDAAALALIAMALPRVSGLSRIPAIAAGTILFFGGYLVLLTGYGKAVVELGVLTAAVGVAGLRVLHTGRGILAFGVALSLALPLHRSAVALVPAAMFVWAMWLRDPRARGSLREPATMAGLASPWVVLAFVVPRVVRTFINVDLPIHLAPAAVQSAGIVSSAFGGLRSMDFLNVILLLSPVAPIIPVGAVILWRDRTRRPALALLLFLVLPLLAIMPFLHPSQGMFRDWDNFIATGIGLSLLSAWVAGEVLQSAPRWAWLGLAASLGAMMPTLQWMLHHADENRGTARIHAFLVEPPQRTESERALAFDFLGIRHLRRNEGVQAAELFREAVALAPSPRLHHQWALAETQAGNYVGAMQVYERLIARTPEDVDAWRGYTAMTSRLEMWPEAKRGATRLLQLAPGDPQARALLDQIARQGLVPDSTR